MQIEKRLTCTDLLTLLSKKLGFVLSGQFLNFPHFIMAAFALISAVLADIKP